MYKRRISITMYSYALLVLLVHAAFSAIIQPKNELYPGSESSYSVEENVQETVRVDLYYECLCPFSIDFYIDNLVQTVTKLHKYLDVHTYPYGNAQTFNNNGNITIKCQHGPEECYGNRLQACAIDLLKNVTEYVIFNGCLMKSLSNDDAADQCGVQLHVDVKPIKRCAKSDKGFQLLKYYGDESHKLDYPGVPYVLINGKEEKGVGLMNDVCHALKIQPKECKNTNTLE